LYSLLSYYSRQIDYDDANFTSSVQAHYTKNKMAAVETGKEKSFTIDNKKYTGKVSYFVLER